MNLISKMLRGGKLLESCKFYIFDFAKNYKCSQKFQDIECNKGKYKIKFSLFLDYIK